jgi:hypothetical protein
MLIFTILLSEVINNMTKAAVSARSYMYFLVYAPYMFQIQSSATPNFQNIFDTVTL